MGDIVLVEGNNELNVEMVPIGVAEFSYVSGVRLIPITLYGKNYYRLEVDIQNVGGVAGVCHSTCYHRIQIDGWEWGGWGAYSSAWHYIQDLELAPGEIGTFACRVSTYVAYPHQYMVKGDAGSILEPPTPLEYICWVCQWLYYATVSFATQEELDAHILQNHPEWA